MSSREAVLSLLRGEEGFLSGQELSRRLQLSRAAVWKAVDALRGGLRNRGPDRPGLPPHRRAGRADGSGDSEFFGPHPPRGPGAAVLRGAGLHQQLSEVLDGRAGRRGGHRREPDGGPGI